MFSYKILIKYNNTIKNKLFLAFKNIYKLFFSLENTILLGLPSELSTFAMHVTSKTFAWLAKNK